jgi:hypothetical protein
MTARQRLLRSAALALLAIPLGACSRSVTLSSARMCSAAGGTYIASVCSQGTRRTTAVQMCQAHGGVYDPVADMCEIPRSSR